MLIPKPKEIILGSAGGQQQEDRTSSSKTSRTIGRTFSGLFFMVRFLETAFEELLVCAGFLSNPSVGGFGETSGSHTEITIPRVRVG